MKPMLAANTAPPSQRRIRPDTETPFRGAALNMKNAGETRIRDTVRTPEMPFFLQAAFCDSCAIAAPTGIVEQDDAILGQMWQGVRKTFNAAAAIDDNHIKFAAGFVNRADIRNALQFPSPKLGVTELFHHR